MDFESFVLAAVSADLAVEPTARPAADAIEFRMDLASAAADQLARYDGELPILATNRVVAEGGKAPDDAARVDALEAAVADPAVEAVDIELDAIGTGEGARVVSAARDHGVAVVVSAHDFEATPGVDAMRRTLRAAADAGDVGKLAVTARTPGDVLDLLAVTWSLSRADVPVATMAMGAAGRHSRVIAPVYGSRIGYAPVDPAGATADGQYDLVTLRTLLDEVL